MSEVGSYIALKKTEINPPASDPDKTQPLFFIPQNQTATFSEEIQTVDNLPIIAQAEGIFINEQLCEINTNPDGNRYYRDPKTDEDVIIEPVF